MTEAEWLACEDPTAMLRAVRGRVGNRKLRLLVGGLYRLRWVPVGGPELEKLVTSIEAFADGEIDGGQYLVARHHAVRFGLKIWVTVSLGVAAEHVYWNDDRL